MDLKDYIDIRGIRQLQDAFSAVARRPIRICRPDGEPYLPQDAAVPDWHTLFKSAMEAGADVYRMPVVADGEVVAQVRVEGPPGESGQEQGEPSTLMPRLLRLMSSVIGRECEDRSRLRTRATELGMLYRLTGEFNSRRDLQSMLDLVARTVVEVLKAKSCSIRLLNEDKTELVIKSVANLSGNYLKKGAILVSRSQIDKEALATGKCVYIRDERTDPRVLYPAQAKREGIVSALCAPLLYKGHPEGVIHVYMAEEHTFDWFEISLLEAVAGEAAAAIVAARLHEESMHSANMKRALGMAATVQRRMIPQSAPKAPGFDFGAVYAPCYELGGDFFDFIDLPPDNIGIGVCDVSGKGVQASLLMASVRASLRAHAINVYSMVEVMSKVNRDLCADTLSTSFATMFYGVLDLKSRRLTYTNAGHPLPILIRDGRISHLESRGIILGIEPKAKYRHSFLTLRAGDVLVMYTDGLSDALNFADEAFGRSRIEKSIQAGIAQNASAQAIAKNLLWDMRRFSGLQTRTDDVSIVVVKAL